VSRAAQLFFFDEDELPPLLEPPVLRDDEEPPDDDPPLRLLLDPPLRDEDDEPPDELFEPPLLERDEVSDERDDDPPLREDDDAPDELFDPPPLRDDDERLDDPPELLPPLDFDAVEREPPPDRDDAPPELPPLLEREDDERELPPPLLPRELDRDPLSAVCGVLRREVLRCSFSPRPALKPIVVRSGILISVPVRGLRPVRAARVRLVNLPNPGIDSAPAACTASEMAPDAVSKIASTTRAAAARVSSAFSATASMNSDLFMSPLSGMGGLRGAARPRREGDTQHRFHRIC
jgi:hypothetical protein